MIARTAANWAIGVLIGFALLFLNAYLDHRESASNNTALVANKE